MKEKHSDGEVRKQTDLWTDRSGRKADNVN